MLALLIDAHSKAPFKRDGDPLHESVHAAADAKGYAAIHIWQGCVERINVPEHMASDHCAVKGIGNRWCSAQLLVYPDSSSVLGTLDCYERLC